MILHPIKRFFSKIWLNQHRYIFTFLLGFKEAWTKRLNPQDIQNNYKTQEFKFNSGIPDVDHDIVSN